MRKDNRGITFVELIIAMAISVIIVGAATVFIGTASKGYQNASDNIDIQTDTQMLMEQVGTWTMEGNGIKVYPKMLVIYYIPRQVDASKLPTGVTPPPATAEKRVIWQNNGKLYMQKIAGVVDWKTDTTSASSLTENDTNCIGDYVQDFTPTLTYDPDVKNSDPEVEISVSMKRGKASYDLKNKFILRNEWLLK